MGMDEQLVIENLKRKIIAFFNGYYTMQINSIGIEEVRKIISEEIYKYYYNKKEDTDDAKRI